MSFLSTEIPIIRVSNMSRIWLLAILCMAVGKPEELIRIGYLFIIRIFLLSSHQCLRKSSALKLNFFGQVYIGNPPKEFKMLFDSASSSIWVSSSRCSSEYCLNRERYNSSQSTTHAKVGKVSGITYPSSRVSGFLSRDTVKISGIVMSNIVFLEVTQMTNPNFIYEGYDGIVGLGAKDFNGMSSILRYLVQKSLIDKEHFSIYLRKNPNCFGEATAGEIILGGSDPLHYSSVMTNFAVTHSGKWDFRLLRVREDNLVFCEFNCYGLIHSAFPYNGFPRSQFRQILKKVGIKSVQDDFVFDCSKTKLFPSIQFEAQGAVYTLNRSDYIFKETRNGSVVCVAGLQENNLYGPYTFILGNIFIRKYYTEFDAKNKMVGFALAKQMRLILL